MRRISILRTALLPAALFVIGCGGEANFDLEIISDDQCNGLTIIEPDDQVRLTVTGPGMSPITAEGRGNDGGLDTPAIPDGKDRVVLVEVGLMSKDGRNWLETRAIGQSAPFDVSGGDTANVRVALYRTNFFSKVLGGGSGGAPCSEMGERRAGHAAALLPDGRVLLAGGFTGLQEKKPTGFLTTVEIFDPATGSFRAANALPKPRAHSRVVNLIDGRILLVGGVREADGTVVPVKDAVLFDGKNWKEVQTNVARRGHTATLVSLSQHVVVLGGVDENDQIVLINEYFDPTKDEFVVFEGEGAPGELARAFHVAELIGTSGNTVVLAGGIDPEGRVLGSVAHLTWDSKTQQYRSKKGPSLETPVLHAASILLGSQGAPRLAVVGGAKMFSPSTGKPGAGTASEAFEGVQAFEPSSGQSKSAATMRGKVLDACAVAIDTSRGVVAGGGAVGGGALDVGEVLSLRSGSVSSSQAGESTGRMSPRLHATCTNMGSRGVLVAGGLDLHSKATDTALIYMAKPGS